MSGRRPPLDEPFPTPFTSPIRSIRATLLTTVGTLSPLKRARSEQEQGLCWRNR